MEQAAALREDSLVLGRYRPLKPLGSGGSGSVWLARDETTDREVALKVVPREGKAGARAEREVEAAGRLRHPSCLRALALARDERHVYVAYPYIEGRTLRETLRGGTIEDGTAVEAAAQVLDALAHAHAKGIVHRDVKPSNIMLEQQEGEGVAARLLDFGLARIDDADTLTAAGDVPGTLGYIAPERLAGKESDGAADVWSVGVLLWEALAGRHPFWAFSPLETARRVEEGAQPLAEVRPDLPRNLCRAVDRMLAPDPRKRPKARQLVHVLRAADGDRRHRTHGITSKSVLSERLPHAALAGVFAGASTALLPFFPTGGPAVLGLLAAGLALANPLAGLALALAAPVLPLGNIALGLALAWSALALLWLTFFARKPRSGLLFLAGPLLVPLHALALLPVAFLHVRGLFRRALCAVAAVFAALVVTAITRSSLPLTGEPPLVGVGLAGEDSPTAAASTLLTALGDRQGVAIATLVLAAAAVTAPLARSRGPLVVGAWGAAYLAAALFASFALTGAVELLPLALGVLVATALLLYPAVKSAQ
jgi:Protein kinase domain